MEWATRRRGRVGGGRRRRGLDEDLNVLGVASGSELGGRVGESFDGLGRAPAARRQDRVPPRMKGSGAVLAAAMCIGMLAGTACQNSSVNTAFLQHPCGLRFRIATHDVSPFINLDQAKCSKQKCPSEAFVGEGGLTYELMMKHVLPALIQQCKDYGAADPNIEFEWYLPATDKTSAETSVNMVCNGGWDEQAAQPFVTSLNETCPSSDPTKPAYYRGPTPVGKCSSISDAACLSKGPDMVAGAVHITTERLLKLQFTGGYCTVTQSVVVKQAQSFKIVDGILNVFRCFDLDLYFGMLVELFTVWLIFMIVEANVNDDIAEGWDAYYDTFYWVFSGIFGGADKAPITIGGKIVFCAHAFFAVIIIASYTGAVSAFLTAQAAVPTVTGFSSLSGGAFSVAVRGPTWDTSIDPAPFLGKLDGGNSPNTTQPSTQFRYLQSLMKLSTATQFKIVTSKRLESRLSDDKTKLPFGTFGIDPCTTEGAVLGAYDMVSCGERSSQNPPDTLIFDTPSVIYELMTRKNATGSCDLVTVGVPFNPSSFGVGFPYTTTFNVAFENAIIGLQTKGVVDDLFAKYRIAPEHNECVQMDSSGGLAMDITEMMGLFVVTAGFFLCAFVHGFVERRAHTKELANLERELQERDLVLDIPAGGDGLDLAVPLAIAEELDPKDDHMIKDGDMAELPALKKRIAEMRDQMSRLEGMGKRLVDRLASQSKE